MIFRVLPFLMITFSFAADHYVLEVEPFDFQADTGHDVQYLSQIRTMMIREDRLYASSNKEIEMLRLNLDTRKGELLGKQGRGPGERSGYILAIGIFGRDLWLIDINKQDRLLHYRDHVFQKNLHIDSFPPFSGADVNHLGCSDQWIVVPAMPSTGFLAMAYDHDVKKKLGFGEPLFYEADKELVRNVPMINQTSWVFHEDHWYGVFYYFPMVVKYDASFQKVAEFSIESQELNERIRSIMAFKPKNPTNRAIPLVKDIVIFRGHLYLLAVNYLLQLDLETGETLSMTRFTGREEDFGQRNPMVFDQFAFREDGTLFLSNVGSIDLWNHDLFRIKSPAFLDNSKEHPSSDQTGNSPKSSPFR